MRHSDWIRIWLQFQLELNNTTIEQMLTCQFDVSRLIRFDKPVIPLLCDRSTLQDVLSICPDSIRELAATAICSLSLAHERLVSDSLLKSFVVRQIGNNVSHSTHDQFGARLKDKEQALGC